MKNNLKLFYLYNLGLQPMPRPLSFHQQKERGKETPPLNLRLFGLIQGTRQVINFKTISSSKITKYL